MAAVDAAEALRASLDADELEHAQLGVVLPVEERIGIEDYLMKVLTQYIRTATPLGNLHRLEEEIRVPIPSRTGVRSSSRYHFHCFIDGWTFDDKGRPWLVEFKLRSRLQSAALISNSRQLRWYAWALRKAKGIEPIGVLVDETWNTAPQPPRLVRAMRKGEGVDGQTVSHALNQHTTVDAYELACEFFSVDPLPDTIKVLQEIVWNRRTPILFSDGELDEAGAELVSAAKLIRDLDAEVLQPIRHVSAMTCNGCRFKDICANPGDELYVDTLFERVVPKRDRTEVTA
jgi:hypothetical protein